MCRDRPELSRESQARDLSGPDSRNSPPGILLRVPFHSFLFRTFGCDGVGTRANFRERNPTFKRHCSVHRQSRESLYGYPPNPIETPLRERLRAKLLLPKFLSVLFAGRRILMV